MPAERQIMDVKPTILVVDDEAMLRSAFYDMLARQGFRCLTAANAIDALQIIEANIVALDLVVTDIKMPGALNGLDLANRVRELQPDTAILMITGYADDPILKDAAARGYRLLEKPFREHHLVAAIREQLAKRREGERPQANESAVIVPLKKNR